MNDKRTTTPTTEVVEALKLAAACIGLAVLLGAMVVAIYLPMWLFVKLSGIAP